SNASANVRRCATLANNFSGVIFGTGATGFVNTNRPGGVQVTDNVIGIGAVGGGRVAIGGPVEIARNSNNGVRLRQGFAQLNGPTIENNGFTATYFCCANPAG